MKRLRPQANLMAVDYDPGSSEANQVNRIKLFMSVAHARLAELGEGPDVTQIPPAPSVVDLAGRLKDNIADTIADTAGMGKEPNLV